MFEVTAFPALRLAKIMGKPPTWQPCRVVGIDASGDEPRYLVEILAPDGGFYLDRVEVIRKPEPKG